MTAESFARLLFNGLLRVHLDLRPDFHWAERFHGYVQIFRLLAFESDSFEGVHHAEEIIFHRADFENGLYEVDFYVSVADGAALPENLFVSVDSDIWIGSETAERISFDGVVLPDPSLSWGLPALETGTNILAGPPHTTLLDLHPLPVTALNNRQFEKLYSFGQVPLRSLLLFFPAASDGIRTVQHGPDAVLPRHVPHG